MLGPIDYIIVGFVGNQFNGSILKALGEAIDSGVIRLVALALISKDSKGNISTMDVTNLGDEYAASFLTKYKPVKDSVDKDDLDEMGSLLDNNTAAGLLVVEQLWAIPLKKAIVEANGVLVAEGRIHPEAAEELEKGGK